MSIKADSRVFEDAEAMRLFTLKQNARVVAWITDNWERCDGLTGPIHKSTVSKALSSMPVVEPVANALDILFDEMRADPWAWCKPPKSIEYLNEYAPMNWWYKVLDLKSSVPWTGFERMATQPLKPEDAEFVQERLDTWRQRYFYNYPMTELEEQEIQKKYSTRHKTEKEVL